MLTIWGRTNSSNVKKVLWCAEELGLPYTRIDAGGAFGKVDDAEYRALNPNGLVPTIRDGEFVLWESNTILRYLASQYGGTEFYPQDTKQRAEIEQWMDWTSTSFAVPFRNIIVNMVRAPEGERDMAAAEAAIGRCAELFAIADKALAERPHLGSDRLSLADMTIGPVAYIWFELPIKRPVLPQLQNWYERLQDRPAFRKTVMIPIS